MRIISLTFLISVLVFMMWFSVNFRAAEIQQQETFDTFFHLWEEGKGNFDRENRGILVDYNLPIYKKRLWVFDMKNREVLLHSKVSHAYNSGLVYASDFSNVPNTEKSSTGIFKTGKHYYGNYGYSMKLHGLEEGKNDNAFKRYIVVHPHNSPYSLGCFMTKDSINKKLIDLTENGTFMYVHKSENYLTWQHWLWKKTGLQW